MTKYEATITSTAVVCILILALYISLQAITLLLWLYTAFEFQTASWICISAGLIVVWVVTYFKARKFK